MKTPKHALQTQRTSCLAWFHFAGFRKSETNQTRATLNRGLHSRDRSPWQPSRALWHRRLAGAEDTGEIPTYVGMPHGSPGGSPSRGAGSRTVV